MDLWPGVLVTFSLGCGMWGRGRYGMRRLRAKGGRAAVVALALLFGTARADAQAAAPAQTRPDTAIAALRAENARLAARVDSLAEGLREHRYPENFLTSALEQQATFYGVFVTVVVAVFGLATFLDFRSQGRRLEAEMQKELNAALSESRQLGGDLRKAVEDALATQRHEAALVSARQEKAERFSRRAAGNAYVAIASVHGPASTGRTIAAHLLAAGNFYAAGYDGRNEKIGILNLEAALRVLNGIPQNDRRQAAAQLAREVTRLEEAFELLRVHAQREADGIVAEIRVRVQELGGIAAPD